MKPTWRLSSQNGYMNGERINNEGMSLLRSLRPINLILVAATQFILYYALFFPLRQMGYQLKLYPTLLVSFITCTTVIAATGYLINDHFDDVSDKYNNKDKGLGAIHLLIAYFVLIFIGLIIAIYIASEYDNLYLALIFVFAAAGLFLYSSYFKRKMLAGNILVSAFTSGSFLIFFIAEKEVLQQLALTDIVQHDSLLSWLLFFGIFSFALSMFREIVKDIQDIPGDHKAGYLTYPIVMGMNRSKMLASFFLVALFFSLLIWTYYTPEVYNSWLAMTFLFVFILIPIIVLMTRL